MAAHRTVDKPGLAGIDPRQRWRRAPRGSVPPFLGNDLAQGRYEVDERPVTVADIHAPMFAVGTVRDHVAPWRPVYKVHLLADTDVTFVLTTGGHNAGIVSEPGHPRRTYQIATRHEGDIWVDPDIWQAQTPGTRVPGGRSWWPGSSSTRAVTSHRLRWVRPRTAMPPSTTLPGATFSNHEQMR